MLKRLVKNWVDRHQHPASQVLHALGIPLAFVGTPLLAILGQGWWAAGAFVGGYALQFIGHAVEGNDAGELILVKKCLRMPYVAIAHRAKSSKSND